ncbi:MAG: tripartite tricarboxylate transporter permease, partial [Rhodospirillales bacterium]|nr:tripartite tricarboxylate transporter permease [Rhodospirillales bacterium]
FGFYPGPLFVRDHPDVMFLVVWSVALASVAGTLLCFAISPFIARLTQVRFALIAAPLILVMVLGSFQATNTIGDMVVLCALGMLGWMMKQGGWPRAPVLVGFVLAGPMEQYFWLTEQLHGWTFLARPGVIAVGLLIVLPMLWRLWKYLRASQAERAAARAQRAGFGDETSPAAADDVEGRAIATGRVSTMLSLVLLVLFSIGLWQALDLARDARLLPMIAIVPGLGLALLVTATDLMRRHWLHGIAGSQSGRVVASELRQFLYLIGFAVGIFLVGFKVAAAFYLLWVLLSAARMRLHWAAAYAALVLAAAWMLADLMRLALPPGLLTSLT